MNFSRREALAGAAACMAHATPWAALPGVGRRLPLTPLNKLEICDATGTALACVPGYLEMFFTPGAGASSKEQEAAAVLGLYGDLLNGSAVQAAYIDGLSADRQIELIGLPEACGYIDFDSTFCRWVDGAVSEVVAENWSLMPSALGRARRMAKALDDKAVRLHQLGRDGEACDLCDEMIRIFGWNSPEGVRARVNKAIWLDIWVDDPIAQAA